MKFLRTLNSLRCSTTPEKHLFTIDLLGSYVIRSENELFSVCLVVSNEILGTFMNHKKFSNSGVDVFVLITQYVAL
jgi:hypothetical protein